MASSIYYSLKNGSSFETFSFDGDEIKLVAFRNSIIAKEFLGNLDNNELDVVDFNSRKKYTDEEALKKNSYVILSRVPKIVLTSLMNKNDRNAASESLKTNHQVATIQPYSVDLALNNMGIKNIADEIGPKIVQHTDGANLNDQQLMQQPLQPDTTSTTLDELNRPVDENVQYYTYCYVDQPEVDALKNTSPTYMNTSLPPSHYASYVRPQTYAYQQPIQQSNIMMPTYVHPSAGMYQNPTPPFVPYMGPPHPLAQPFIPPPVPPSHIHSFPFQPLHHPFPPPPIMSDGQFFEEKQRRQDHRRRNYYGADAMRPRRMERFHHCDEREEERGSDYKKSSSRHEHKDYSRSPAVLKKKYTIDKYSHKHQHHHHGYSSDEDYDHRSKSRDWKHRYHRDEDRSRHKRSRSKEYSRKSRRHGREKYSTRELYRRSRSESYDSDDIIKINNGIDIDNVKKGKKPCKNQIEDVFALCDKKGSGLVETVNKLSSDMKGCDEEDDTNMKNVKQLDMSNDTNAIPSQKVRSIGIANKRKQSNEGFDDNQSLSPSSSSRDSSVEKLKGKNFEPCSPKINKKVISVITVTSKRKTVSNQLSPNIS